MLCIGCLVLQRVSNVKRKNTQFTAQIAANLAIRKAMDMGIRGANLFPGPSRDPETAVRSLQNLG